MGKCINQKSVHVYTKIKITYIWELHHNILLLRYTSLSCTSKADSHSIDPHFIRFNSNTLIRNLKVFPSKWHVLHRATYGCCFIMFSEPYHTDRTFLATVSLRCLLQWSSLRFIYAYKTNLFFLSSCCIKVHPLVHAYYSWCKEMICWHCNQNSTWFKECWIKPEVNCLKTGSRSFKN